MIELRSQLPVLTGVTGPITKLDGYSQPGSSSTFDTLGEQRYVASGSWIYREEAEVTLPIIADLIGLTDVRIESVESLR